MELWDIIDIDRNFKGYTIERGQPMKAGDFHLVVHIWTVSSDGRILITQRAKEKEYPLFWEVTGGSAISGDTSISAAIREVKEETGVMLNAENGRLLQSVIEPPAIYDIWLFEQDFDVNDVILQDGETIDARAATVDDILMLKQNGQFLPVFDAFNEIIKVARAKESAHANHI